MRQAFPYILQDYDANKISISIDGINTKLSDIDFYDNLKNTITHTSFAFDYS